MALSAGRLAVFVRCSSGAQRSGGVDRCQQDNSSFLSFAAKKYDASRAAFFAAVASACLLVESGVCVGQWADG